MIEIADYPTFCRIAALATLGVDYVAFRDIRKMRDKERRENEERENHSLTIVN